MTFGGSSTHKAQASRSQVLESSGESEVDNEVDKPPPSQQPKLKDLTVQTGVQNSSRVDEPPVAAQTQELDSENRGSEII